MSLWSDEYLQRVIDVVGPCPDPMATDYSDVVRAWEECGRQFSREHIYQAWLWTLKADA